ncbi:hypothetical protein [Pseudoalteromonas sp. T1lg75]|uniref:hypothetical protein n=1 Tax=Pseudoalteromonas sp. T1lg75 TaxID=2077102 RepID=UPI000CF6AB79|nr:hypothetical protein [Pseudoalteromonas sp. T1lg75]
MIKRILSVALVFLAGCSDAPNLNSEQAIAALQQLNARLSGEKGDASQPWPYTPEYLKQRHDIYNAIARSQLTPNQAQTLDYLITEERFVRRYQPWPLAAKIDASSAFFQDPLWQEGLAKWLRFVEQALEQGQQSKIYLNAVEMAHIQAQLGQIKTQSTVPVLNSAIASLETYLSRYMPRNQLGLGQLPNGAQWYQAKINYYSNQVRSPIQWYTHILGEQKGLKGLNVQPLPEHEGAKIMPDLDWRQSYGDLRGWAKAQQLTPSQRYMALIWMEVDLGVHAQMWSEQFAYTALANKGIDAGGATRILMQVLAHPGQSFIYADAVNAP